MPLKEILLVQDDKWARKPDDIPPRIIPPPWTVTRAQTVFEKIRVLPTRVPRPYLPRLLTKTIDHTTDASIHI